MNVIGILRDARLISWLYRIVAAISGILVIRMITDRLGVEAYGEVAFVVALLSGLVALDFGFMQAVPRFVAKYSSDEHAARLPVFWAACVLAAATLWVLQLFLVAGLALVLGRFEEVRSISALEFLALGITTVTANVVAIGSPIAAGFQRYGLAGTGKVVRSLLYLLTVWLLWLSENMTVAHVLWANGLAFLLANLPVAVVLRAKFRSRTMRSWHGFPRAHRVELREVAAFSLNGWLFTAANIIVSSGTIVIAGVLFSVHEIALLQIALVLYTAVAALVTGSMVPLSTIAARHQDRSPAASKAIATTALDLVEEALVFAAGLIVFFVHFGVLLLGFMLGAQNADALLLARGHEILLAIVLPAFAALPLFTFRFVLVDPEENRAFSRGVLVATLGLLGLGALVSSILEQPLALAIGAGCALSWRAAVGYRMGRHALPGVSLLRITFFMVAALAVFEIAFRLCALIEVRAFGLHPDYFQAAVFLALAALVYWQRGQAGALLGVKP